jgi:hypothetical protein
MEEIELFDTEVEKIELCTTGVEKFQVLIDSFNNSHMTDETFLDICQKCESFLGCTLTLYKNAKQEKAAIKNSVYNTLQ